MTTIKVDGDMFPEWAAFADAVQARRPDAGPQALGRVRALLSGYQAPSSHSAMAATASRKNNAYGRSAT